MESRETRVLGVRPEPHLEGSELGAVGTKTFPGSRVVASPASAYVGIVTDSFYIAGSRALGELGPGICFGAV